MTGPRTLLPATPPEAVARALMAAWNTCSPDVAGRIKTLRYGAARASLLVSDWQGRTFEVTVSEVLR